MQWLIDIIKAWIVAQGYLKTGFVKREDRDEFDFEDDDFIADVTWRSLDISHIVPEGATAIAIFVWVDAEGIDKMLKFAPYGYTGHYNGAYCLTQVAGQPIGYDCIVGMTVERKINYICSVDGALPWELKGMTIKGWWF